RPKQTLDEALGKNPPVMERRNLTEDSFQFPERGVQLVASRVYAWRVTASDQNGKEVSRSGASFFGLSKWPPWTFCALIMYSSSFNFCIGQMSGLTVAIAFMTGTGPYFWTLTQTNGPSSSGSSGSPAIFI